MNITQHIKDIKDENNTRLISVPASKVLQGESGIGGLVNALTAGNTTYVGNGATNEICLGIKLGTDILDLTSLTFTTDAGATATITSNTFQLVGDTTDNLSSVSSTITVTENTVYTFGAVDLVKTVGVMQYEILDASNADAVIGTNLQTFTTPVGCLTIKLRFTLGIDDSSDCTYSFEGLGATDGINSCDFTVANNGSGYWLDRSNTNVVINGTFDVATDWTLGAGWAIDDVTDFTADCDGTQTANTILAPAVDLVTEEGRSYQVAITVIGWTAGNVRVTYDGVEIISNKAADGTYYGYITAGALDGVLNIIGDIDFTGSVDTVVSVPRMCVRTDAGVITESGSCDWLAYDETSGETPRGISKVFVKARDYAIGSIVFDGLRGVQEAIYTDTTTVETNTSSYLVTFTPQGSGFGSSGYVGTLNRTYLLTQDLYPTVRWGLTNHGKVYVEACSAVDNKNIIIYEGSSVAGHELPQNTGVQLRCIDIKNLTLITDWSSEIDTVGRGALNLDSTLTNTTYVEFTENVTRIITSVNKNNTVEDIFIAYGKANSNTFKLLSYIGTETKNLLDFGFKPSEVIIKKASDIGNWYKIDNTRGSSVAVQLNLSDAEIAITSSPFTETGIEINELLLNASAQEYIALAIADTNKNGGGSYENLPSNTSQFYTKDLELIYSNGYINNHAFNTGETLAGTQIINPIEGWL